MRLFIFIDIKQSKMGFFNTLAEKPLGFTIEHYPITGKYFPKYGNQYMLERFQTGIIELVDEYLFAYADSYSSKERAEKDILMFKEQQLKENIEVFKIS